MILARRPKFMNHQDTKLHEGAIQIAPSCNFVSLVVKTHWPNHETLSSARPRCDNRVSPMTSSPTLGLTPRTHPGARPHARRIRKDQTASGRTRTHPDRAWHLQRDVERALLLQVIARSSETPAHAQPPGGAGARRECGHRRHRRWLGLRLQDRVPQSSVVH